MKKTLPASIKDVALLRSWGSDITLSARTRKEVIPYEIEGETRDGICLSATFHGLCDHESFSFNIIYASGHNPGCAMACASALTIANARLKKDYDALEKNGIPVARVMFAAADEFPGMESAILSRTEPDTLRRMIRLARLGEDVRAELRLRRELVDAELPDARRLTAIFTFFHEGNSSQAREVVGMTTGGAEETDGAISAAHKKVETLRARLEHAGIHVNAAVFSDYDCILENTRDYIPLEQAFEKKLLVVNN